MRLYGFLKSMCVYIWVCGGFHSISSSSWYKFVVENYFLITELYSVITISSSLFSGYSEQKKKKKTNNERG